MKGYREEFILSGSMEGAPGFISLVCEQLKEGCGTALPEPGMLQRAKWVIMELHSNSLRHANAGRSRLTLTFDGDSIVVEKKDNGHPLSLSMMNYGKKCHWPLDETFYNDKFDVYGDDIFTLKAEIDTMGTATFSAHEQADNGRRENMSEHFGLLIMARASDQFTYRYDVTTGENIFSCLIKERKH